MKGLNVEASVMHNMRNNKVPIKKWACLSYSLDAPISGAVAKTGETLYTLDEITAHNQLHNTGGLKESTLRDFDVELFFKRQVAIVIYYKNRYKNVHVHVHRGKTFPPQLRILQKKLEDLGITNLTFGWGYYFDDLRPPQHLDSVDVYISFSMHSALVGGTGEAYLPSEFAYFDIKTGVFDDTHVVVAENDLCATYKDIAWMTNIPDDHVKCRFARVDGLFNGKIKV